MKKGEWVKTVSSNINRVKYDQDKQILSVEFFNHIIYHYHDVPETEYAMLLAADSIGSYFARNIKDQFEYTKED
ncbi:MAG: KTSC domain-containing protein [Alteromonas sp.]|nr:KTSC domain-containing protein [Alteromonas sp.]|tara:strand:- start:21049 stop:21270 length:222 start_codon:yes stop_codon:yes gene_type:complete